MVLRNACQTDSYVRNCVTKCTFQACKTVKYIISVFPDFIYIFDKYFVDHLICPKLFFILNTEIKFCKGKQNSLIRLRVVVTDRKKAVN